MSGSQGTDEPPTLDIPTAKCQKCGHSWHPKTEQPKVCAECKNPNWWKGDESPYDSPPEFDLKRCSCSKCGEEWTATTESPQTCPYCKNPNWYKGEGPAVKSE